MDNSDESAGYDIAIVGMALRVPGAKDPDQYWKNLHDGIESVTFYSDEELLEKGIRPGLVKNPNYVKAGAPLDDVAGFDPDFFGFSPKEAGILDPQHRHFYECSWEALERAGHVPEQFDGAIGVFAGSGMAAYFAKNIMTNQDLVESVGMFLLRHTGNDKDFLSTRVSYNLDLKGPAVNVQTACSTSSVATHLACQSLMSGECDMALAGGVTLEIPHGEGYLYKENEILSPDGHCRPFDHNSKGTIFGSGVGVVVLRRLEDALEDGDHIHAVISGSAINNDGSAKMGYLAPSVEGQAQAIAEALAVADLAADDIEYIECHGTGTPVGDPIEVAALTQAFRQTSSRNGYCGIGSVKSNIGHLDTAAGVAGLIKTALAIENGKLPPSLNYEAPNPTIDFVNSPFYVNDTLRDWKKDSGIRRAAVNSLGVGGTNAFVILEEAPEADSVPSAQRDSQLFVMSAKNRQSLDDYAKKLSEYLKDNQSVNLADVAHTLFNGRRKFSHRRVFAASNVQDAIDILDSNNPRKLSTHTGTNDDDKSLVFMFPGGGAQYAAMAKDLYAQENVFKQHIDRGLALLLERHDTDLKPALFAQAADVALQNEALQAPSKQLPAIFIIEYALAQLWLSLGVKPDALIGHSMGENTAACVAGVISFEDALGLVVLRGQLMDRVPSGGMLSVQLAASDLRPYLSKHNLELASVNSPELSVASGHHDALDALASDLKNNGVDSQRVAINIAAHSSLLDGILEEFRAYLKTVNLRPPQFRIVSNRTGDWLTDQQACSAEYWVEHLRNTVQFADGIALLLQNDNRVFLEIGPGNTLSSLTRQNPEAPAQRVFSSLRHPDEVINDNDYFVTVMGKLWASDIEIESSVLWPEGKRQKLPLPTYAFQHKDYWIAPGINKTDSQDAFGYLEKLDEIEQWYKKPVWVQQGILPHETANPKTIVIFNDESGLGRGISAKLKDNGHDVVMVDEGDAYYQIDHNYYRLSPEMGGEGYSALFKDLVASGKTPDSILHLWLVTEKETFRPGSSFFHRNQEYGFYSLYFIAKAIADENLIDHKIHINVASNGMQQLNDELLQYPEKSTVLGPVSVIPREFSGLSVSSVDVSLKNSNTSMLAKSNKGLSNADALIEQLVLQVYAAPASEQIVLRDDTRWVKHYDKVCENERVMSLNRLKKGGVYFITGGLGGVGLVMAKFLASTYQAKLILMNRTPLPERGKWSQWLQQNAHDDPISRNIKHVKSLEDMGADVLIESGDVTDIDRLEEIISLSNEKFGEINGVIHAAGTVSDNLIQLKSQDEIESVFTPKVYGTLNLDKAFAKQKLDFMVLFSSTSTAIAPIGQIDYVAANAYLNAYAQSVSQNKQRYTVAINWGIWNEVGMAAASAKSMGYDNISTEEVKSVHNTIFESVTLQNSNNSPVHLLSGYLSEQDTWLLDEHRTRDGQAILPGTAYIELARAGLEEIGVKQSFTLKELVFFRALYVDAKQAKAFRVKLIENSEGYQFQLQSKAIADNGSEGWEVHAEARVLLSSMPVPDSNLDQLKVSFDWQSIDVKSVAAIKTKQEDNLLFGPRWQVLKQQYFNAQGALGHLCLDEKYVSDLSQFKLHPGLLDIATGFAMSLIDGYDSAESRQLWVPVSYSQFQYYSPLTQEMFAHINLSRMASVTDDFASFDVTLFDTTGKVAAVIKQLTVKKLSGKIDFSSAPSASTLEEDKEVSSHELRQLSPSELSFQHNLSQGILPDEGVQALETILNHCDLSQIIYSSLELKGLIKEAEASAAALSPETDSAKFSRPDLDSEFVEAKDDIERTLVSFWSQLLGVDQVGTQDSFFDLGGHSLIAVRLFAKIQQAFGVDYPISVLFEAPTIAACANLIRDAIGGENSDSSSEAKHTARYQHIVPMHSGKPGNGTPFFLVAGMFGNVLNLRHLAHLIGSDRPIFGLQARGLYGDHEPHETFEQTAQDYIKELKSVQPKGPYLLGGFSGGGITAFEMAKQLRAMGDEVVKVIMLDTPLSHADPLSSVDRMSIHWQRLRQKGTAYFTEWAKSRYQWELQKFRNRFGEEGDSSSPYDFHSENIRSAFYRALAVYNTDAEGIDLSLFRPKLDKSYLLNGGRVVNSDRELVYEDNGWTPYVSNIEVIEVPGNHDSMVLEPNVRVLASQMARAISNADKGVF